MALCTGERKPSQMQCNGTVYKCTECGAEGCMQNKEHACSNQGFSVLHRCYKCGAVDKMEMVKNEDRAPRKTPVYTF